MVNEYVDVKVKWKKNKKRSCNPLFLGLQLFAYTKTFEITKCSNLVFFNAEQYEELYAIYAYP